MCHTEKIEFFGAVGHCVEYSGAIDGLAFANNGHTRSIAVMPDIYGLTDFYIGYASYIAAKGARVFLTNPWCKFGDLPKMTREAAYGRRHKLEDNRHCDDLETFLAEENVDAIVGFCIGGNFAFEMARRGYEGTIVSVYPLPWGMDNQDRIAPAFDYMPDLEKDVTILIGAADHLAGPKNIKKLEKVSADNPRLTLHLYEGSNHGFFTDIDGDDESLRNNAERGINIVSEILFPA